MAMTYKNMVKMLSKKYPGEHIEVSKKYQYFSNDEGYFKTVYGVYVENIGHNFDLSTFTQVEKYVKYLCEKEA